MIEAPLSDFAVSRTGWKTQLVRPIRKYAEDSAVGWQFQTLASNGFGFKHMSLAFTVSGLPALAYLNYDDDHVYCATYSGASWSTKYTYMRYAQSVSLALATNGNPSVAAFDSSACELRYAVKSAYGWGSTTTVESFFNVNGSFGFEGYASLAFAPDGYPAISYYDDVNGDLKYAKYNGAQWTLTTVDAAGDVGLYTSLAFSPQGRPTITYFDKTNGALKLAEYVEVVQIDE